MKLNNLSIATIAKQVTISVIIVLALSTVPSYAGTTVSVGNPSSPSGLAAAIQSAYTGGASTIIVNPGVYTMPSTEYLPITGWSNATISCYGCTFIITNDDSNDTFWTIENSTNVTLEGGTITGNIMTMSENPIVSLGSIDSHGYQTYNVTTPTGYPALTAGTGEFADAVDGITRQYKVATGDFYNATVTSLGSGEYNVDFNQTCAPLSIGDYIVSRNSETTTYKVYLQNCTNCTVKDLVMYRNGFSAIREDSCTGTTFSHDTWAPGPPPSGSTHTPLFSCSADGSDALTDTGGPTYINCSWLGLLNDDDIAIHGTMWPIVSTSGTSVVIADSSSPVIVVGQPLRFFSATFYAQGNVTAVSDNGTDKTVTMDANYSIPSGSYASNPDDCGAGYKILNCYIGSTRSRGIIAKADNGLIEGNTIYNAGISAVRLGQEGVGSNEAGFAQNVSVRDNVIIGNGAMSSGYDAAFRIGAPNGEGDGNIVFENNDFLGVTGPTFDIQGANGVQISDNVFANTAQITATDNHILDVTGSNSVTLTNNIITNRGINTSSPWYSVNTSTNIGTTGVATGTLSGGIYQFNHSGGTSDIDVPSNSATTGTDLQLLGHLGTSEQCWLPTLMNNGYYTIGHLGTNEIMDVPNGSKTVGADVDQWAYNTTAQDSWSISDAGNGTQVILNDNSGLALDELGNSNTNGTAIDQNTVNGSQSEAWITQLIAPAASTNFVQNNSLEANGNTYTPSNWTLSSTPANSGYVQAQSAAEDGSYILVMYATAPYNATATQTITGLQNGYYTVSAYVMASASLSQAYMFAENYGAGVPELTANAPLSGGGSLASWRLITIPCVNVTNNQCVIGFYANDATGSHPLYVDNVQLVRSYSAPVQVDLTSNMNNEGVAIDGVATTTGGLDGGNDCYSATLLGTSQTWNSEAFNIDAAGTLNDLAGDGQSVTLPKGPTSYSHLYFLGTAVNGTQSNQTFTVNYTTGSPQTFTQTMSDWMSSGGSSGETTVLTMSYADNASGAHYGTPKLYGYSFALDNTRIPSSIDLPNNANVKILAMNLAP